MNSVTLYHNPRCSKSRQTLALLREKGVEPTIIEYLKTPPSSTDIKNILMQLDMQPRDLMRRKEEIYQQLQLDNSKLSEQELINSMVENPQLIERPIVLANNKAAIGRPPEKVLEIL